MNNQIQPPPSITVAEAAKEMGVSVRTITRRAAQFGIPATDNFKLGNKRRLSLTAWDKIKAKEYSRNF